MIEILEGAWIYIKNLGAAHNVNPVLFGILYLGSIPPYLGSMGWIVRNYRKGISVALPIISTLFFFILPSLYIAIFGKDVAWWVYLIILILLVYGGFTAVNKVRSRISESQP